MSQVPGPPTDATARVISLLLIGAGVFFLAITAAAALWMLWSAP